MKNIFTKISMTLLLLGFMAFGASTVNADDCVNTTALAANGTSGDICSAAAFTSGASSAINGDLSAQAAITLGATTVITGSVTGGGAFTTGIDCIVNGNVTAVGAITLGANTRVIGTVHSDAGVITYGVGATVGGVIE